MTTNRARRVPIAGAQLVGALIAMVLATAVLPPAAAWALNATRIAQTQARATSGAAMLRARAVGVAAGQTERGIICGPGRLPDLLPAGASGRAAARSLPSHGAWLVGAVAAPEVFGAAMGPDAWGRCFLLNVRAGTSGAPVWLLSAGPNALVETPTDALTLAGDDIGVRVR